MFCDFHRILAAYEQRRFCQCRACISAINLTLKVITHYGEFTGYNVQQFNKLIGKDIIIAHQLLKNDIDQHEYWLVTKSMLDDTPADFAQWMQWKSSTKQTESGEIPFHYTQLTQLKNDIQQEPLPLLDFSNKAKMIMLTRQYDTDIITLFHATGDFNYRSRWQHGVKAVEEVSHFLPRVGMRCRSIMENGQATIYASSYSFRPERIEFSETDENDNNTTYYILEKVSNHTTRLTLEYYVEKNIAEQLIFRLTNKKKIEDNFKKSLTNLAELVKEIKLPPTSL